MSASIKFSSKPALLSDRLPSLYSFRYAVGIFKGRNNKTHRGVKTGRHLVLAKEPSIKTNLLNHPCLRNLPSSHRTQRRKWADFLESSAASKRRLSFGGKLLN